VQYAKPAITYEQQADQLLNRGMIADRGLLIQRLQQVSYYRLSGYWYPFRKFRSAGGGQRVDDFDAGTDFAVVWDRYVFDRRLRLLMLDAIERIEIAVRSTLAYHHSHQFGLFAYATDANTLPGAGGRDRSTFLQNLQTEINRSKDTFVKHFKQKYGDQHAHLPVWMAVEIMAFGSVLTFYRGSPHRIKRAIASAFGMPDAVFSTWLLTLNTVRNICAHHGRLWNREIGTSPFMPLRKDYPDWHAAGPFATNRLFMALTVCKWCVDRVAPQSHWADRVRQLLAEFPSIPRKDMGFPKGWEQSPIWISPPAPAAGGNA
jgi:abortive infection bacteriophage resistance protein